MKLDLHFDEVLPHPIELVWRMLTDPDEISAWLMPVRGFRAEVGARFTLETRHLSADGVIRAEVVEVRPPHLLVWAWSMADERPPSMVTFELEAVAEGTRLHLHHHGEIDPAVGPIVTGGWPGRLALIASELAGHEEEG